MPRANTSARCSTRRKSRRTATRIPPRCFRRSVAAGGASHELPLACASAAPVSRLSPGMAFSRRLGWHIALFLLALVYALPVARVAYDRFIDVTQRARERLIIEYRLWELHPEYRGTPQAWTRFAARLLTDNQLLRRLHAAQRELAPEIELDYRRDLTVAQSEVVLAALAAWAAPVALLYGIGFLVARRRQRGVPEKTPARPAYSEAKYRPDFKKGDP